MKHFALVLILAITTQGGALDAPKGENDEIKKPRGILELMNEAIGEAIREAVIESSDGTELWISTLLLTERLMCSENLETEFSRTIEDRLGTRPLSRLLYEHVGKEIGRDRVDNFTWIAVSVDMIDRSERQLPPSPDEFLMIEQGAVLRDLSKRLDIPNDHILRSNKIVNVVLRTTTAKAIPHVDFVDAWACQGPEKRDVRAAAKISLIYKPNAELLPGTKTMEIRLVHSCGTWLIVK